jgi:RNA polymerase sigma-70 factor (ECF subfamily)
METTLAERSPTTAEGLLVERARAGDQDAFGTLVQLHLAPTFRTAMAVLGNEADARDATQEIFVRAWQSLSGLREPNHFEAWLGRITVNTCRSAASGRRRRTLREIPAAVVLEDGTPLASAAYVAEPRAVAHDQAVADLDVLERALERISIADRTLLALHHFEHRSLEQIGQFLGVPAKTVKSRLFTARRALERALEEERR